MLPVTIKLGIRRFTAVRALLCAIPFFLSGEAATAKNLLRNPGFELVPGTTTGQGLMPNEWVVVFSTPDTYSVDGSYGLLPAFFGNFTGVSAFEGLRWVAGWSAANESFGQTLTTPLVAEKNYRLTGRLHQALRTDLNNSGGYRLLLALPGQTSGTELTTIGPTTGAGSWEPFEANFVAPVDAGSRPLLIFDPFGSSAYPGIDALVLESIGPAVPSLDTPMLAVLLGATLLLGVIGASRTPGWPPQPGRAARRCDTRARFALRGRRQVAAATEGQLKPSPHRSKRIG